MIPKNSLIVSYYFPPSIMVGGRRWAKFSKYLNRDKTTPIWVLTFDSTSAFVGPWNEDITGLEKKITRIPLKVAPYFKRKITSSSLAHKVKFKASYYLHKSFLPFTKGDSSDLVCDYKTEIISAIKKIVVEKNITTIIVTGAPFRLCYYAALVKETFCPSVNLIVDYRDFWIEGSVFERLSQKRKKQELQFEQKVVEQANTILAVNTMILDRIKKHHPSVLDSKLIELPHAYDPEDLPTVNYDLKNENDLTVRMIYAGSLYPNMEFSIQLLCKSIRVLLSKGYCPRVDIYSYTNFYKDIFEKEGVAEYVFY
ncbi:MAG: hypothetical protein J0M08_13735, partial [Bacteroidetes bacterium]|nr:hypothetical protein [Bacteroidota bacterium]